jgi:glutamate racemase
VPLIENGEFNSPGADYFVEKYIHQLLSQSDQIDSIVLGCTHYPLMIEKIRAYTPQHIRLIEQGEIVANSLQQYLERHVWMDQLCSKNATRTFYTTENEVNTADKVELFFGAAVQVGHIDL